MGSATPRSCGACGMALPGDAFLCPKCELIVANPDTSGWPEREHDNSLIRAFLEPPEPSVVRRRPERPALPPEVAKFVTPQHREVSQPTVKTPFVADSTDIPVVVGALDLTLISMSPFEALVVSFMDGTSSVNAVRQAAGLSKPEIQAVLMVLIRKGVVVVLAPAVPDSPVTMEAAGLTREAVEEPPPPRPEVPAPVQTPPPAVAPPPPAAPSPPPPVTARPNTRKPFPRKMAPPPPIDFSPVVDSQTIPPVDTPAEARPLAAPPKSASTVRGVPVSPLRDDDGRPPPPRRTQTGSLRATGLSVLRPLAAGAVPSAPADHGWVSGDPRLTPLQRAIALEREGDLGKAIDVLEQGVAVSKDPAPLYNRLALVLVRERRDYARAEQCMVKACGLQPNNPVYEQNLQRVIMMAAARSA